MGKGYCDFCVTKAWKCTRTGQVRKKVLEPREMT